MGPIDTMTNKEAAEILRDMIKKFSDMPIPRGTSKSSSIEALLTNIAALSIAVDLLEKTPD